MTQQQTQGATAGPWKVFLVESGPNKGMLLGVGVEQTGEGVTDGHGGLWGSGGERLANAYLIAAAPCMNRELRSAVGAMNYCRIILAQQLSPEELADLDARITSADAALAKAKPPQQGGE